MILWIASWHRSGNTFTRICLNKLYGIETYTGFASSEDLTTRGVQHLTGYQRLPARLREALAQRPILYRPQPIEVWPDLRQALEELDAAPEVYCIKTHRPIDMMVEHRTLLPIRDPRDCYVSMAYHMLRVKETFGTFLKFNSDNYPWRGKGVALDQRMGHELHALRNTVRSSWHCATRKMDDVVRERAAEYIDHRDWALWHEGFAQVNPQRAGVSVLKYSELVADPVGVIGHAMDSLAVPLAMTGSKVPVFSELKAAHPGFFRKGVSGGWKQVLTVQMSETTLATHGEQMQHFGLSQ